MGQFLDPGSAAARHDLPTPIPSTEGAFALFADGSGFAAALPLRASFQEMIQGTKSDLPIPEGTEGIAPVGNVYCAHASAGKVHCRGTNKSVDDILRPDGDEIVLPLDDAVALAAVDHVLCVERRRRIECVDIHAIVHQRGKFSSYDANEIVSIDAGHVSIGPNRMVCGVRGDELFCATTFRGGPFDKRRGLPGRLRLPTPATTLFGGDAGLCAVVSPRRLACIIRNDVCLEDWLSGGCSPTLEASPFPR